MAAVLSWVGCILDSPDVMSKLGELNKATTESTITLQVSKLFLLLSPA